MLSDSCGQMLSIYLWNTLYISKDTLEQANELSVHNLKIALSHERTNENDLKCDFFLIYFIM